jgi:ribosomal protein L11 methylase PrmA
MEKAGKTLVLSGILVEQKTEILRALSSLGTAEPEVNEAGEWISVVVKVKSDE